MRNAIRKDIQIPVVIMHTKMYCDIYIPDMEITIHGRDYVDTISNAIMKASAIYYYNLERNIQIQFTTTYQQAESMCKRGAFASYIGLIA